MLGTCARVSSRGGGGWGDEARRNLEAALARAGRRLEAWDRREWGTTHSLMSRGGREGWGSETSELRLVDMDG